MSKFSYVESDTIVLLLYPVSFHGLKGPYELSVKSLESYDLGSRTFQSNALDGYTPWVIRLNITCVPTLVLIAEHGDDCCAQAVLLAKIFSGKNQGVFSVPLIAADSANFQIPRIYGEVVLRFLVVRPLSLYTRVRLRGKPISSSHPCLRNIGHRGSGNSHSGTTNCSWIRENTLLAFQNAYEIGKRCVEFDVHLSADGVAVIYHDFVIAKSIVEGIEDATPNPYTLPIYRLTKDAFSKLSVTQFPDLPHGVPSVNVPLGAGANALHNVDPKVKIGFPTLRQLFVELPKDLAFDVEIKYPSTIELTGHKLNYDALERNYLVDTILEVVSEFGRENRPLFFSSFDADVCALLKFKQHVYPVLLLTDGSKTETNDSRVKTLKNSIEYAHVLNLDGVVVWYDELIEHLEDVQLAKKYSLKVATYGESNNSIQCVEEQLSNGVEMICSDLATTEYSKLVSDLIAKYSTP